MLNTLKHQATFVKQFGARFETTGSIVPSSRFVAKAITRYVQQRGDEPIRILECGPGTGPFSDFIVRLLQPGDAYHLVELNENFVDLLHQRFAREAHWTCVKEMTEIFNLPIQDFNPDEKYDYIISGLPHINFPTEVVEQITASYFKLLKPGGMLSYFEYMYVRPLRKMVTLGNDRRRVREVNAIMEGHIGRHRVRRESILINVPPVWVQHLHLDTTA